MSTIPVALKSSTLPLTVGIMDILFAFHLCWINNGCKYRWKFGKTDAHEQYVKVHESEEQCLCVHVSVPTNISHTPVCIAYSTHCDNVIHSYSASEWYYAYSYRMKTRKLAVSCYHFSAPVIVVKMYCRITRKDCSRNIVPMGELLRIHSAGLWDGHTVWSIVA